MTLERPFRLSVLTLVGTGLAALTLALGSLVWLVVGLGLFAACVVAEALRPQWRLPRVVATGCVVVALQAAVVEVVATGGLLVAAAHFLILTQLVWLTQERTSRHYGWLCLMSLLQVMLAGVLSVDLAFGLCLFLYLPVGVLALLLFNLRCELERCDLLTPSRLAGLRIGVRLLTSAALVALAELVLTILVFVYFPRFGLQILQLRPVQHGPRLTGFSDEVRLGDIARILDNPEVVLSVRLTRDGQPTRGDDIPLLWRGISLDTYEEGRWFTRGFLSAETATYRLDYPERPARPDPERDVVQEIALEPVNSRVLFHLPRLLELRRASPNLDEVDIHRTSGTYSSAGSSAVSLRYLVRSRLPQWSLAELQRPATSAPPWPLTLVVSPPPGTPWYRRYNPHGRFLQFPPNLGPRVRELAAQIVAEFPPAQVYNRIRKVETHLKAHYAYTRSYGDVTPGLDPVEDFLFEKRAGHCEHFAAAMVVLLRSLGIPSRMVTGFRGGEWNEYGQFYVVRQLHAHAWVEARVPATKDEWVSFDPTPAAAAPEPGGEGWLARVSRRLAYLRLTWNAWVVNFSSADQKQMAESLTRFLSRLPDYLPRWGQERLALDAGLSAGLRAAIVLGVFVVLGGGAVALFVWLRRRHRRGRRGRFGRPAVGFYRRMEDLLRRRGFRREPTVTPREFAHQVVAEGGGAFAPVEAISDAFCRVFYGGRRLSAVERGEVARALGALEGVRRRGKEEGVRGKT